MLNVTQLTIQKEAENMSNTVFKAKILTDNCKRTDMGYAEIYAKVIHATNREEKNQ